MHHVVRGGNVSDFTRTIPGRAFNRFSSASGAALSVLSTISAVALPSWSNSRLMTMSAMFTLASPKLVPTVPITPGWSLLMMSTMWPSGIMSIA